MSQPQPPRPSMEKLNRLEAIALSKALLSIETARRVRQRELERSIQVHKHRHSHLLDAPTRKVNIYWCIVVAKLYQLTNTVDHEGPYNVLDNISMFTHGLICDAFVPQWLDNHWFREWLVACSAPSHCLNQCWFIGTYFCEFELEVQQFSSKTLHLKISSAKWWTFTPFVERDRASMTTIIWMWHVVRRSLSRTLFL